MRALVTLFATCFAGFGPGNEFIDPDVYEPDDTPAQATPITLNQPQSAHNIHFATFDHMYDIDYVSLNLTEPKTVLIERPIAFGFLSVIGTMPMRLFDSDLHEIGSSASIHLVDLEAGVYFISITSRSVFNVSSIVPWYSIVARDAMLPDVFEDNDTQETATYLPYDGKGQAHNFDHDGDVDWFTYVVGLNGAPTTRVNALGVNSGPLPVVTTFADGPNGLEELEDDGLNNGSYTYGNNLNTRFFIRIENPQGQRPIADTYYTISVGAAFRRNGTPSPGTIVGVISSGGDPVAGATVRTQSPALTSTFSDQDGVFAFPNLPSRAYVIEANKSGFLTETANINLSDGDLLVKNFSLDMSARSDLNGDTSVNSIDIQAMINAVLGTGPTADPNNDGSTNAADIQTVINDVLGI